jgi:hypothetical protein
VRDRLEKLASKARLPTGKNIAFSLGNSETRSRLMGNSDTIALILSVFICVYLQLKTTTIALLDEMTSLCEERGTLGDETRSALTLRG